MTLLLRSALRGFVALAALTLLTCCNEEAPPPTNQECFSPRTVRLFSGSGIAGYVDGTALMAQFNFASDIAVTPNGQIFVADANNHRIRRVDFLTGAVTTVAGTGMAGFVDGTSGVAQFNTPTGICAGNNGLLYIADRGNHSIRGLDPNSGEVFTIAGNGTPGFFDASGSTARFSSPEKIAIDGDGFLYVTDAGNNRVRRLTSGGGATTTLAGGSTAGYVDGPGAMARFNGLMGITVGADRNVYVTETVNHTVRRIDLISNVVATAAGDGSAGFIDDLGANAKLNQPTGVVFGSDNVLYIADRGNHRIRIFTPNTNVVSTAMGNGTPASVDGGGTAAQFNEPTGIARLSTGELAVAERAGGRLRRVSCE